MRSISNQEFCCKEWQSAGGVGWQELVRPAVVPGGHNRHVGQQPRQIAVRIQPTFFRRFNHAVDHGAALCAPRRVGEEKILPANHKGFYGTFGKVVAQLQPSVLQYTDQIRALFLQLCPAQILAQRWLFLPMPTKRPSRAWTVPDAAYIVLRVAVLLIPAQ